MTGLPDRTDLAPGNFSGEVAGHRWRVDVLPFYADFVDPRKTDWVPQTVVVRVQSPSGPILQINTVACAGCKPNEHAIRTAQTHRGLHAGRGAARDRADGRDPRRHREP
jgi:hypothetical protein